MISRKIFPMRYFMLVAAGMLAGSCLPLVAQELAPVPSDAAQQEAVKLIEEVYGEEHAQAKTSAEKTAVANQLLKEASESKDPANRYVLLRVARDMATQAGDVETAFQAIEEIGKSFQVDSFQLKGAALSQSRKSASMTTQRKALAEQALALIEEAVERDDFAAAEYLGQLALDSARKARERDLTRRIVSRNKMVTEISEAYSAAKDAFLTLEESPADAEANLAAGKYLCFMKGNWDKGIPMLALGSDAELKSVATRDLRGATSAEQQVALGDAWWDLAESRKSFERESTLLRAGVWYRQAKPSLGGLAVRKIEKRMAELSTPGREIPPPPQAPPRPPPPAVAPFDEQTAKRHQAAWAGYLKAPMNQTNSIGMKLVLIPAGEFLMGSTEQEVPRLIQEFTRRGAHRWVLDRIPSEAPGHRVKITRPFYLSVCEVTQAEYDRVMGTNPSQHRESPTLPVERVTWNNAVEFCRRLSELPEEKAAGRVYRLPTEAEWEYACRAGTTTRYNFGDEAKLLHQFACWLHNSRLKTRPVGQMRPNAWGVFDMHGNAWEWCADWYGADYYQQSPVDDPAGPDSGDARVLRGGSCKVAGDGCRCVFRFANPPGKQFDDYGFRVVGTAAR